VHLLAGKTIKKETTTIQQQLPMQCQQNATWAEGKDSVRVFFDGHWQGNKLKINNNDAGPMQC